MFDDPGAKLKNVAVIEFAVIAAVSFIMAFVLGIHGDDFRPLPFFLLLIGGPLFAYLSALVLYGFGELIDNTEALRLPQKKLEKRLEQQRNERITRAAVEAIADGRFCAVRAFVRAVDVTVEEDRLACLVQRIQRQ